MNLLTTHKGNPNMRKGAPSVNPAGRPLGARQRIAEKMLTDLADIWQRRGAEVLERLADEEPAKLAALGFGLLPKDIFVKVQQAPPRGLSADDHAQLVAVLDAIEQLKLGDVPPAEIFAGIEMYLRSEFARTIEHQAMENAPATAASDPSGHPEPIAATIPAPPF
jgi:hypothetical protein